MAKNNSSDREPDIEVFDADGNEVCAICWGGGFGFYFCPGCGKEPPDAIDLEDMELAEAEAEGVPVIFFFGPK
jgi:hypothetical protein